MVPDGVLVGSSKAHKELRPVLIEGQKLDAVVSLPGGVFEPYAGVPTAALLFTKTNSGGTDHVWFYDAGADGWSPDDKRTPLLPADKLGPVPAVPQTAEGHAKNNLPDVLARWRLRDADPAVRRPARQPVEQPGRGRARQSLRLGHGVTRAGSSSPRRRRPWPPPGRSPPSRRTGCSGSST